MLDEISQFIYEIQEGIIYNEENGEQYDLTRLSQRQVLGLFKNYYDKKRR